MLFYFTFLVYILNKDAWVDMHNPLSESCSDLNDCVNGKTFQTVAGKDIDVAYFASAGLNKFAINSKQCIKFKRDNKVESEECTGKVRNVVCEEACVSSCKTFTI